MLLRSHVAALPMFVGLALWSCASSSGPDDRGSTTANSTATGAPSATSSATTSSGGGARPHSVVLRNGSVVDPRTQTITTRDLYICDGVIVDAAAGEACAPTEIAASGKWILPALTDMHVHARGVSLGDEDFKDIPIAEEATMFRFSGVTTIVDAMNDEAKIFPLRDMQRASGAHPGADIFAVGGCFTPTGGHGTEYGLPTTSYHLVDSVADVATEMSDILAKKPDLIKIMYDHLRDGGGPDVADGAEGALGIAMKKEVMQAIVATANAAGVKTQVHTGTWNDARAAIEAGATMIAHLGEPTIPDDLAALAASKGVYWLPTLSLYHGLNDIIADQSLLDDPLLQRVAPKWDIDSYRTDALWVDPDDAAWLARHKYDFDAVAKLHQAGVKLLAGTDTVEIGMFVGWSLHRELTLFVKAGLSPWEALATATTNAGDFLGLHYGVDAGAEGSVVVLDASPIDDIWNTTKIDAVIHHGDLVALP